MTGVPLSGASADAATRFTELFGRFWDSTVPEAETARQVAFIEQYLDLPCAARLLVVPACGGRVALGLGRRGHRVLGVDTCPDAAARGTLLAQQSSLPVAFMADGALPVAAGGWDAAICLSPRGPAAELGPGLAPILRAGARVLVEAESAAAAPAVVDAFVESGFEALDEHAGFGAERQGKAAGPLLLFRRR